MLARQRRTGYTASYGVGQYVASEAHQVFLPVDYKGGGAIRGVVFCHGAGGTAGVSADFCPEVWAIAKAGFPVITAHLAGTNWANDAGQSRVTSAWTYLKDHFGAKTDKMLLWGSSMGGALSLTYTTNNASSVAAVGCIVPALNIDDIHDNDRGSLAAGINTAYTDAATWETAKSTHDPYLLRSSYNTAAIPTKIWYGGSDTVCLPAHTETFDADCSNVTAVSLGAVDHAGAIPVLNAAEVISFLGPYSA